MCRSACFSAAGVDSSAVAALMTKIRREPIETFSVGYGEQTYSELPYRAHRRRTHQSKHHEVSVSEQDFFGALPHLIWHEDEPIVWPSSVSLYFVARLARERVTVVLTGEGARRNAGRLHPLRLHHEECRDGSRLSWRGAERVAARAPQFGRDLFPAGRNAAPQTRTHFPRQGRRGVGFVLLRQFLFRLQRHGAERPADRRIRASSSLPARPTKTCSLIGSGRRHRVATRCCSACSTPTSRPTWSNCS